ncbi:MAG: ABC transporter ATP-binding protein [Pyrinomonadaceae bacterium MAG19_C2-C3]|nr:ABC transporter ATP-binding protein [Pyrinomonadaceae bacterium MAG19_C2-C3]
MKPIIQVENLSKRYVLGARSGEHASYGNLRETLAGAIRRPLGWVRGTRRSGEKQTLWALRDVSFDVRAGETVGIIGRNGAGKSTLLKVLSRITEPTSGRVRLYGRVGSLLEVGTGFHPELTGRENIFLNGSILGMNRIEITKRFDEIVAFAEVEEFIDTPVKRYSSGMYMRLAFAVAAHLQPEILIVDEVLAVGDAQFQKKCLGKMGDVARSGRTVLFVSHNMAAVTQLCNKAILMERGKMVEQGETSRIVQSYLATDHTSAADIKIPKERHSTEYCGVQNIQVNRVKLVNAATPSFAVRWKEPLVMRFRFTVKKPLQNIAFGFSVATAQGINVFAAHHTDSGTDYYSFEPGVYEIEVSVGNPLRAGLHTLSFGAHNGISRDILFLVPEIVTFEVLDIAIDDEPYLPKSNTIVNGESCWMPAVKMENEVVRQARTETWV